MEYCQACESNSVKKGTCVICKKSTLNQGENEMASKPKKVLVKKEETVKPKTLKIKETKEVKKEIPVKEVKIVKETKEVKEPKEPKKSINLFVASLIVENKYTNKEISDLVSKEFGKEITSSWYDVRKALNEGKFASKGFEKPKTPYVIIKSVKEISSAPETKEEKKEENTPVKKVVLKKKK